MSGRVAGGVGIGVARVFVRDPALLRRLSERDAAELRRRTVVKAIRLRPGPVASAVLRAGPEDLGFLVLEGLLVQRLPLNGRWSSELVGPGEVVLPVRGAAEWRARTYALLAVLDRRFAAGAAAHPAILAEILERHAARGRRLARQLALARLPRMEDRLHALLWLLAQDFGDAGPAGARLVLPVTQETLAELVGGRRQAVNGALQRLRERGLVATRSGGLWQLRGPPLWSSPKPATQVCGIAH